MAEVMPWVADMEARERRISDWQTMRAVLWYCKEHNLFAHVVHTPPESTIGGFSRVLVSIGPDWSFVEDASGRTSTVRTSELYMRAGDR